MTETIRSLLSDRDHRRLVEEALPSDLTPPHGRAAGPTPTLDQLESVVARACGTTIEAVRRPQRGHPNPARTMIVTLGLELRIEAPESLAARYGLGSASAVRTTARRGRVRLNDDPAFRRLRDRVIDQLLRACLARSQQLRAQGLHYGDSANAAVGSGG